MLREGGVEELDDWNVETVEPEDRFIRFVAVIVPHHRRGEDKVAVAHRCALAVDRSMCHAAIKDEAERALGVPVDGRDFSRQDELHPGVEIVSSSRLAAQTGILEDED